MTKIKYDRHEEEWQKCLTDEKRHKVGLTWLKDGDTLNNWRENRKYDLLQPIIDSNKEYSWLTVGDGRYGTDAHKIIQMGSKKVLCTDISDTLLKIGYKKKFITNYSAENAEKLSLNDDQFDFVFCKEAYHHFPRPHIALHEMLRVCKIGTIIIEPRDHKIDKGPFSFVHMLIKRFLSLNTFFSKLYTNNIFSNWSIDKQHHYFETVGNYLFTISEREIEKIQLGMHRQYVAFKGINDSYEEESAFIEMSTSIKSEKKKIIKTKMFIKLKNLLCRLGIMRSGLLASILFKSKPSTELLDLLKKNKWKVKILPKNPYL